MIPHGTRWGWAHDKEDLDRLQSESQEFFLSVRGQFEAPAEIDPRGWHKIENQRSMGSCQGHALSSVCEMCYRIATGKIIHFSRMWCYIGTQRIDGITGDRGSTITGGRDLASKHGVCREETWPYPQRYTRDIPDGCEDEAKEFKIKSHTILRSYHDTFAYLASGQGGVEIGISWNSSCDPRNGVIASYKSGRGGGHAVSLLGYSSRKDNQDRNYLWMANSWGEQWGNNGWAEVAPAAIDAMLDDRYTVFVGMSDLTAPEPRMPHYDF